MTNIDRVKKALEMVNSRFTLNDVHEYFMGILTREQISKALRSISYVTSLGNGRYRVNGRKTR